MTRFSWIWVSYVMYVSVLYICNVILNVMDKPILSLGHLTSPWFIGIIFVFTYVSEVIAIVAERRD